MDCLGDADARWGADLRLAGELSDVLSPLFPAAVAAMCKPAESRPRMSRAILAADAPRSERDPDLEVATVLHPVTGTFADPTLESAFAVQFFRLSFPSHAFLMALLIIAITGFALSCVFNSYVNSYAVCTLALLILGLGGRVLAHHMEDRVRGQRVGSWTWAALMVVSTLVDASFFVTDPAAACLPVLDPSSMVTFAPTYLVVALANGSHGIGFVPKAALMGVLLVDCFAYLRCGVAAALVTALATVLALVGFVVAHLAEMYLRHSYAERRRLEEERRRLEESKDESTRRLEVRNEQLRAEKERLMYDMQRRGHPIDDDNRSAIHRGLQAGPDQPHHGTNPSEAGGPAPSGSQPPSLPPGPPSSTAGESFIVPPPVSEADSMSELEEAVTDLMWDEEAVLDLQSTLSSPPAQAAPEEVAGAAVVQPRVIAYRVQEAVDSRPEEQGGKRRQRQEPHLPVAPPVAPSCCCQLPGRLDHSQGSRTPRQQALHVARQSLQIARTDMEIFQVVRELSVAFGSIRTESGTIKAVHAVLLQLDRPGMSEKEAYASTGASMSNFKKWRKRVQHAQLGLPPPQ